MMDIKQECEYNADDGLDKHSTKVEEVKISKCDETDSTTLPFEYMEDNKIAVKNEIENIEGECFIVMDSLLRTCGSSLEGMKVEQTIEIGEPSKLTADTKECMKVEKNILALGVKTEEQESYTFMDSTKLEVLTEELHIKPDSDISNNRNSDAELDRAAKKKIQDTEHHAVHRKADKASFICYGCNFVVHSKKDLINHINIGDCSSKIRAKKTFFGKRLHKLNKYICTKCRRTFKGKVTFHDHVVKKHEEFIASVSSKIYQCKHCTYKTTIPIFLAHHMREHPKSRCSIEQNQCIHCNKEFKSKSDLDYHVVKNHEAFIVYVSSKIHQCKHCSYKTTHSTEFARHIKKHPESKCSIKQRPCIYCDAIFKNKPDLDDHVVKKHVEFIASVSSKIHECKYCDYKTTISTLFTSHMTKHPKSGYSVKRSCIHCDKTFNSKRTLDDHIVKKHEKFIASVSSKIHRCKHCNYKTTISTHLASHMTKHPEFGSSNKQMLCNYCDEIFKSKQALDNHVIKKHKEFIASVSSKLHQCKHCSYETTISSHLVSHLTKHPEFGYSINQSQCFHCGKTFNSKRSLDDHIVKKHEKFMTSVFSKIYQCEHCSYTTTKTYSLARHITKHPESGRSIKRMQCFHCDKTFNSKRSLDDHVIKKHEEFIGSVSSKIYRCKHCSYKTTNSSMFAYHETKHPESGCSVKRSECIHCDKTFARKASLDDHVLKKHAEFIGSVSSKIY